MILPVNFYFHCLAYGRVHRNNMIDYLFPSLVNSLENAKEQGNFFDSTLLLHTSPSDSVVIRNNPNFKILSKLISIEMITIPEQLRNSASLWKAPFIMNHCHRYAFDRACLSGSVISFLSPDTVVSTNFISRIFEFLEANSFEALLAPAVRLTYLEDFLGALDGECAFENRTHFSESSLVKAALNNLHHEAQGFVFNKSSFLGYQGRRYPTSVFFPGLSEASLIGFGMSWFLMAIDTSKIDSGRRQKASFRLTYETIDGGFLGDLLEEGKNSTDFILDSCESFIVSWDQGSLRDKNPLPFSDYDYSEDVKCDFIEWGLYSGVYDDFKIGNFNKAWFWHVDHNDSESNLKNYSVPIVFKNRFLSNYRYQRSAFTALKLVAVNQRIRRQMKLYDKRSRLVFFLRLERIFLAFCQKYLNKLRRLIRFLRNLVKFNKALDNGFNISNGGVIRAMLRLYLIFRKPF